MNEKLNKFLAGIKNVFMSNRTKTKDIDKETYHIGIDLAVAEDCTVFSTKNSNKYLKTKCMIEVDRLFEIMTRVKKHRVKKKIAKRIKKIKNQEDKFC